MKAFRMILNRIAPAKSLARCTSLAGAIIVVASFAGGQTSGDSAARFQAVLDAVPTSTTKETASLFESLVKTPEPAVTFFVSKLNPNHDITDQRARYALTGMVWESGRGSSKKSQPALAAALVNSVKDAQGVEAQDFVLEQVQYAGSADNTAKLLPYLDDAKLRVRALKTLVVLKSPDLQKDLSARLASAEPDLSLIHI